MDFTDQIRELASRIEKQREHLLTEEAAKTACVMPFINALGYNVFDPTEVVPEYTADVGVKKGEKVDYVVQQDGKPIMLFECKSVTESLGDAHTAQLYRYFSVMDVRIAILTNGAIYQFFSDLDEPNKMDKRPFFEVNLLVLNDAVINELKKFTKDGFDVDELLATAGELKYTREIKRLLGEQLSAPSDEFVRFIGKQVYPGIMTQSIREMFTDLTKRAFAQFINDRINERLKSALNAESLPSEISEEEPGDPEQAEDRLSRIMTTEEELEGYYLIKSILRDTIDPPRITHRDAISYMAILLDDNNRKPVCRLHFNRTQKYIGFFDAEKNEERVPIDDLNDIYKHADRLKATIGHYETPSQ